MFQLSPATAQTLRPVAELHGSCTAAVVEEELQAVVNSLKLPNDADSALASWQVRQPEVPPSIATLWREAGEWHFSHDHCNCFGCNISPPTNIKSHTIQIFGDEECRQEWAEAEHIQRPGQPSVADPGWLCIGSFSEFDYLFCSFDAASPHFGKCCQHKNLPEEVSLSLSLSL
jgi:hypothetical protein